MSTFNWKKFLIIAIGAVGLLGAADAIRETYKLNFREAGGSNKVTVQPPALSSDYTLTLPTDDGNANQVLTTDGNGTLSWGSSGSSLASAAKTANYTLVASDDIIYASAATNFTLTIPSAASSQYKSYILVKADNNMNPVPVSTAGGFTRPLYTPGETYKIHSDGTTWNIIDHKTYYKFPNITSLPSIISVSTGTKPFAGTTTASGGIDMTTVERDGIWLRTRINFKQTTAGTAGGPSACYLIQVPYGYTMDLAYTGTNTATMTSGNLTDWRNSVGNCRVSSGNGTDSMDLIATVMSNTVVKLAGAAGNWAATGCWGTANVALTNGGASLFCDLWFPVFTSSPD